MVLGLNGDVAGRSMHLSVKQEKRFRLPPSPQNINIGSNVILNSGKMNYTTKIGGIAQMNRAFDLQSEGQGFDSLCLHQNNNMERWRNW